MKVIQAHVAALAGDVFYDYHIIWTHTAVMMMMICMNLVASRGGLIGLLALRLLGRLGLLLEDLEKAKVVGQAAACPSRI